MVKMLPKPLKSVDVMEELLNVLDGYFGTIIKTGYLPTKTVVSILLMDFLNELKRDQELPLIATCEQLNIMCELQKCIIAGFHAGI